MNYSNYARSNDLVEDAFVFVVRTIQVDAAVVRRSHTDLLIDTGKP